MSYALQSRQPYLNLKGPCGLVKSTVIQATKSQLLQCSVYSFINLVSQVGHEVSMASDVLRIMPGLSGASPLGMLSRCSSPAVSIGAGGLAVSAEVAAAIGKAVLAWAS